MFIVHVHAQVTLDDVELFKTATIENARQSLEEPGVVRFDVMQRQDDPMGFLLVEVYRSAEASAAHKDTRHYQVWRDAVAGMMAAPRTSVRYSEVYPPADRWETAQL
jgi:quinol monooxygenase YgiN